MLRLPSGFPAEEGMKPHLIGVAALAIAGRVGSMTEVVWDTKRYSLISILWRSRIASIWYKSVGQLLREGSHLTIDRLVQTRKDNCAA